MNSPLFPLLLAAYPVVFIAVGNPGQASWQTVGVALSTAVAAAAILLAVMRIWLPSWTRAALGAAAIISLFYAYGPVHTYLEEAAGNHVNHITGIGFLADRVAVHLHPILTAVWIAAAFLALRAVWRTPEHWIPPIVQGCNTTAFVLVGLVTVQGVVNQRADTRADDLPDRLPGTVGSSTLGYEPDIYTIVLDGYARGDVLRDHYRFDNSAFLDGLRTRGFQVSDQSHANYTWTFLSLASTLNMQYLQPLLGDRISPKVTSRAPLYDAVHRNAVSGFLKKRGYRIIHFQSTEGATLHNPYADQEVSCHRGLFINDFYRVIALASWLKALDSKASIDLAECHHSNLANLGRVATQEGPKFVFAHFISPHHPYLFDRSGNVLRHANLSNQFQYQLRLWEQRGMYVDQLIYMNHRITQAVDEILAASRQPPIIIIHSDHGPNLTLDLTAEERARIRLATLSVSLLPRAPVDLIPNNASLVNQFRYVINYYFNAQMEILPNRHYLSTYDKPYEFVEVMP